MVPVEEQIDESRDPSSKEEGEKHDGVEDEEKLLVVVEVMTVVEEVEEDGQHEES